MLQQYLPFTVLKPLDAIESAKNLAVATVLTVYGIETTQTSLAKIMLNAPVATVLTVYGIETTLIG